MATTSARRSTTFKQFLLRVHPDHFRAIPKVHDENLHSIQLLNQFMDEQRAASAFFHHGSSQRTRVFFSAYVPTSSSSSASEKGDTQQLKRFRLDLATNIETHMARILRECGVEVPASATTTSSTSSDSSSRDREAWDYDSERYRATSSPSSSTARGGMDFGFNAHFAQYAHTRRRKRSIRTLPQFFAYMDDPETRAKQQQVRLAHDSIQSVSRTLTREFGLREVATSCGWASVPLNATLLSLAKTLRKLRHSVQLHGVRLDMRADASEIDFFDEYTVVLNVADVPLQWVELLETLDAAMLQSIHAAHASLEKLQRAAERALGAGTSVRRGRTCSALAYRGFLQDVATTASLFGDDPVHADYRRRHDAVVEQVAIVVEDAARECEILDDGTVRAPSCSSAAHVLEFVDAHRDEIRDQVAEHEAQRQQFASVAAQCVRVLGLESLTFADGLRLQDVNRASAKLLAFASDGQRYGSAHASEVLQATQGRALRFDRYFGLAQDGVFTLPTEWMAS